MSSANGWFIDLVFLKSIYFNATELADAIKLSSGML